MYASSQREDISSTSNLNIHRVIILSLLAISSLLCLNVSYAAGPNLIANGSFEAQDFTNVATFPNGFTGPNGTFIGNDYNSNTLTGWNFTENVDGWSDVGPSWALAQDGNQFLDLMGNNYVSGPNGTQPMGTVEIVPTNVLSQTINTTPGAAYVLSFYWGEDVGHDAGETVTFQVAIEDSAAATLFTQTLTKTAVGPVAGLRGPNTWDFFETTFIATTTTTTFRFTPTPPSGTASILPQPAGTDFSAGAALDNVAVHAIGPIPTLNTWALIMLSLLLVLIGLTRKPIKS